ncbi:MAG: hypothetical protein KGH79_00070 [Patescibacteria group bacterium]|nr:hypothetical protein [Patescibacteria group bacterium]
MATRYIVPGLSDDHGNKDYWEMITEVAVAKAPFDSGMKKRLLYANQVLKITIRAEGEDARAALDQLFTGAAS